MAADTPDQDLSQFFSVCNDFIHGARLRRDCNVLIHCLAGMSRSVTICVVYVMSISSLNWRDALKVVRVGRKIANPNSGFQIQLQDFENNKVDEERRRMKERFPSLMLLDSDTDYMYRALEHFDKMIATRDLCHFNCKRNENCPTGMPIPWSIWPHLFLFSLVVHPLNVLMACKVEPLVRKFSFISLFFLFLFIVENIIENEKFAYFEISK